MKRKFSRKYLKVSALALVTMCASLGQANANMTGKLSLLQEFDFQASSGQPSFPSFAKFADVSYNLKLTHQARFSGNVGPFDSKSLIPHNPQAILVLKKVESPQDYVTALAFLLFPSPGSDRIIATQNPSDPIANLTIDQIGRLIQGITQGNMKDAATIYDVISSGSATPDQALAHEFYGYDVRRKLMGMYIHRIRSQIHMFDPDLNPDLQQGGDSTNIHHPVTDEIMTTDQCRDFVREFASNAIPVVQSVIRKFGVSVPDSEAKSYNGGIARFEKKRKELMQWRFSEVLALAFTEESMGERAQLSLIPRMLLTFGLFKSRTADDVRTLYKSAFGVTLSDDFETKILTQDAYRALRKSSLDLSQLTPDILRMLSYGYEVFDAEAPVELPYAVAQYTPKFEHESPDMEPLAYFFPDCVETSILNAFNFLHFKFSGNKTFDIPSLRNTLIGQFYQEYPTIDAQSSKDARNAWASLVSRVPGVTYCKSTKKGRAPTYELKSGIKNSLKIFKFLLGDQSHFFSAESDLTKAWTDLLKTFYQNQDESIEVQAFSSPVLDSDLGDILFSIKKRDGSHVHLFELRMNPDHGSFKSWVPQSVDWRKNLLSSETILKNLDWLPYVGPYLTRNIVKNVFPRLSHKDQTMFLTACDTKSVESTIEILSIVMQDPKLRHKKWINSAVQGILSLDDGHAFHETQDMLFHLLHHNLAPREIILEIVNRLPARTLPLFIYSNKDKLGEGVSYGSLFDYGFAYKIPELSQKWHEYIDSDPEYLKIFPTTDIQNYAGISSYEDIAINDAKITPEIILTLSKLSELNRLSIYSTGDLKSLREMFGLDESNLKILFESFTKKFERLEVSIFNKTYTSTSDIGNSEIHEKEQLVFRFFDLFYKYAKYLKIDVKMTDPTQGACPELKDRAQTFKNALIELAKKYGHASPIFQ